ncbi:serine hydrolase [Cytophagaceae bacterium ABcell3]|nr:serine hydrolase [Cytophagaceae bacterium ABcell3]
MRLSSWIYKSLFAISAIIIAANVAIVLTGNTYLYRVLRHRGPSLFDYQYFPQRSIAKSNNPEHWEKAYNTIKLSDTLRAVLSHVGSKSFLVVRNDSIIYEEYWSDAGAHTYINPASVAKSYMGALIGVAIKEGYITDVNDPVGKYLPHFNEGEKANMSIKDLLTMSSGFEWSESSSNPFSHVARAYYADNLWEVIENLNIKYPSGKYFQYSSGDSQTLGFLLEQATGIPVSTYLQEKLWKPMGEPDSAMWSMDENQTMEKTFCCLNATTRQFARLGQLYLNKGNWNGKQLIDTSYIEASTKAASHIEDGNNPGQKVDFYGYHWWIYDKHEPVDVVYYARGIQGQYLIVIPERNLVLVNMSERNLGHYQNHPRDFYIILDEALNLF